MRSSDDRHVSSRQTETGGWTTALALAIAIAICLAAFVWIFLRLDPYLSDFISDDSSTPISDPSPTAVSTNVYRNGVTQTSLLYLSHEEAMLPALSPSTVG